MDKQTIYGPPGTGKTTYLIKLLEEELTRCSPDEIAYVSYTRKGTYEGVERAREKFSFKEDDLPFFRTLHSLSFRSVGASKESMVQAKHYKRFSEVTGIPFTGYYMEDHRSDNDAYLHTISMRVHNPKLAQKLEEGLDVNQMAYIAHQYKVMKKQLELRDFDDLLVEYMQYGESFPVKVAFIDEAQDLTPLQWSVAMKMFKHAERVYVAGDDDQAVYTWAGADVLQFMNFSRKQKILSKSYRLPSRVLSLANNVVRDIRVRKAKSVQHNGEIGNVQRAGSLTVQEFKGGELLLARTNYILKSAEVVLQEAGYRYTIKGKDSIPRLTVAAINAYRSKSSSLSTFADRFRTIDDKPWQENLIGAPEKIAYYERALSRRMDPITLETYHSAKGSEAEHVVVLTDLSARVAETQHTDDELRCLYVALTRAKSTITLVAPTSKEHYPTHYFKE